MPSEGGVSFLIHTIPAFGISSLLYAAQYFLGRTPIVFKKIWSFFFYRRLMSPNQLVLNLLCYRLVRVEIFKMDYINTLRG